MGSFNRDKNEIEMNRNCMPVRTHFHMHALVS
jgi:hypothetical protein